VRPLPLKKPSHPAFAPGTLTTSTGPAQARRRFCRALLALKAQRLPHDAFTITYQYLRFAPSIVRSLPLSISRPVAAVFLALIRAPFLDFGVCHDRIEGPPSPKY